MTFDEDVDEISYDLFILDTITRTCFNVEV